MTCVRNLFDEGYAHISGADSGDVNKPQGRGPYAVGSSQPSTRPDRPTARWLGFILKVAHRVNNGFLWVACLIFPDALNTFCRRLKNPNVWGKDHLIRTGSHVRPAEHSAKRVRNNPRHAKSDSAAALARHKELLVPKRTRRQASRLLQSPPHARSPDRGKWSTSRSRPVH